MSFVRTAAHSLSRQRVSAPVHSPGDRSSDCTGTDLRLQLSSILRVVVKVFCLLIPILVTKFGWWTTPCAPGLQSARTTFQRAVTRQLCIPNSERCPHSLQLWRQLSRLGCR